MHLRLESLDAVSQNALQQQHWVMKLREASLVAGSERIPNWPGATLRIQCWGMKLCEARLDEGSLNSQQRQRQRRRLWVRRTFQSGWKDERRWRMN